MVHLVYCDNAGPKGSRVLDRILSCAKTMVVRGAAGRKIPHSRVFEGEELYFMEKGTASIAAKARVTSVENHVKLTEEDIDRVLSKSADKLSLTPKQLDRWRKKCLCLVSFEGVERISPPFEFEKQNNMDDWLILDRIEDVCKGTSKPYNYENSKL